METVNNAVNNVVNQIANAPAPLAIPFPVANGIQGGIAPITPAALYFIILISYMLMMIVNRFGLYLREAVLLIMPVLVVGGLSHYYPNELQFPGPGTFAIAFGAAFLTLAAFSINTGLRKKLRDPDKKGNMGMSALVYILVAAAFAIGMYLSLQFGKGPMFFKL